jgi:galactitol-specific phosphotransferase system IIB component
MPPYKIRLVYGWCGNLRLIVAEHLEEIFKQAGVPFKMSHQSVWENPTPPQSYDLVLQLMPAFSETEAGCPVINIKPLLVNLDHKPTIEKIMRHIKSNMSS